jgi:hypothetical protein
MPEVQPTRRELIHKAVYVTPAVLTLPVLPAFASAGSGAGPDDKKGKDEDKNKGKKK